MPESQIPARCRVEPEASGSFALVLTYKCGHAVRLHYLSREEAEADGSGTSAILDKCWSCRRTK